MFDFIVVGLNLEIEFFITVEPLDFVKIRQDTEN